LNEFESRQSAAGDVDVVSSDRGGRLIFTRRQAGKFTELAGEMRLVAITASRCDLDQRFASGGGAVKHMLKASDPPVHLWREPDRSRKQRDQAAMTIAAPPHHFADRGGAVQLLRACATAG